MCYSIDMKIFLILLFFSISFFSCEGSDPEILNTYWQINVLNNLKTGNKEEALCFYAIVSDDDGEQDIESIFVINDELQLFWTINNSNWQRIELNGEKWLGCGMLQMTDGGAFPRLKYRISAKDSAGGTASAEINLNLESIDLKLVKFPELELLDKSIKVLNYTQDLKMIFYNSSDIYLESLNLQPMYSDPKTFPKFNDLQLSNRNNIYIYRFLPEDGYGLMSGPYSAIYDRYTE